MPLATYFATLELLFRQFLANITARLHIMSNNGNTGRSQEFILTEARGLMASAGARAYNGGLEAEPPAGSRGRAPGQGVRGRSPPEAERL